MRRAVDRVVRVVDPDPARGQDPELLATARDHALEALFAMAAEADECSSRCREKDLQRVVQPPPARSGTQRYRRHT